MEGNKTPQEVLKELETFENDFSQLKPVEEMQVEKEGAEITPTSKTETTTEGSGENKQAVTDEEGKKIEEQIGAMIKGDQLVNIMDIVFARVFTFGTRLANYEASVNDYKLSEAEKKQVAPFLEKWVEKTGWFKNLSVEKQLMIVLGFVYGLKIAEVAEKNDERKEKKEVKKNPAKKESVNESEIKTEDGRPFSRTTHFLNGKVKQGK